MLIVKKSEYWCKFTQEDNSYIDALYSLFQRLSFWISTLARGMFISRCHSNIISSKCSESVLQLSSAVQISLELVRLLRKEPTQNTQL